MFDLSKKECYFTLEEVRGDRKILLKHIFRLPSLKDWIEFHKGTTQLGLSKGKDTVEVSAMVRQERDTWLWDALILRVEGYKYSGQELMEKKNWKEIIPLPHKLESISGFLLGYREDVPTDEELIVEESLDLAEGAIEMQFAFLQNSEVHRMKFMFKAPDSSDYLRFSRLTSKMQLQRTKQRNVSAIRVPTDVQPFIELFDKLINKVEGYQFDGKDLMKAEDWKAKVDAYHKQLVVREIFTVTLQEIEGKA